MDIPLISPYRTDLINIYKINDSGCILLPFVGFIPLIIIILINQLPYNISFIINLIILTNLIQYYIWKISNKYSPIYLLLLASIFIMINNTQYILIDYDIISKRNIYKINCKSIYIFNCLTLYGWIFNIICPCIGYILMFISILNNFNIKNGIKYDLIVNNVLYFEDV